MLSDTCVAINWAMIIGSDNSLSPFWYGAFIWIRAGWLLIGLLAMKLKSKYSKFHKKGIQFENVACNIAAISSRMCVLSLSCCTHWQSHIPQCAVQNGNVHISVLNGALWDMEQAHCGICEIGLLPFYIEGYIIEINGYSTLIKP